MGYDYLPIKMANLSLKTGDFNCCLRYRAAGRLKHHCGNAVWEGSHEKGCPFLVKLNMPCDPIIQGLGIRPREMRTYILTKSCIRMFIATLITVTKTPEAR
jgi:hypothetical protein